MFWFWETNIRLDEILWTSLEVTSPCPVFRLFYLGKECLYLTSTSPTFFSPAFKQIYNSWRVLRKHSHQLTSLKESTQDILLNLPVSWPSKMKSSIIFKSAHGSQYGWILFERNRFLTGQPVLSCSFFLNRFPVYFNLFVLLFPVAPCLLVALQPCMERIPIKRVYSMQIFIVSLLMPLSCNKPQPCHQ